MSNRATSTNASTSARPLRMIIHGKLPERGRLADPRGTFRTALAGRCRGAGATVEPVGREPLFDRVADGAGFSGSVIDRRTDGSGLARSASVLEPAIPVSGKPCARWNCLTADSVSTP